MSPVILEDGLDEQVPVVYVLSDARGETANAVVEAAAAQFGDGSVDIVRVPNVKSADAMRAYFDDPANYDPDRPAAVFHTFADAALRREVRRALDELGVPSIDLLGPAVNILSTLTGEEPSHAIGAVYHA